MISPPADASPAGKVSSHANSREMGCAGAAVNPSSAILISTRRKLLVAIAIMVTTKKDAPRIVTRHRTFLKAFVFFTINTKKMDPISPAGIIVPPNMLT